MTNKHIAVITAGCFDILHAGHINLLLFCRQIAGSNGIVHVSIDSDSKITADKGPTRPIFDQAHRFEQLRSIAFDGKRLIDYIHIHETNEDLDHKIRTIVDLKTKRDIIVVGDSYKDKKVIGSDVATVIYFPQSDVSSSFIESSILKKHS